MLSLADSTVFSEPSKNIKQKTLSDTAHKLISESVFPIKFLNLYLSVVFGFKYPYLCGNTFGGYSCR
ncbi:MAG: hypothetical protein MR471_07250, partial [Clostridia bacterium]|nr:hypothetical protein [Clostridia bacterium]